MKIELGIKFVTYRHRIHYAKAIVCNNAKLIGLLNLRQQQTRDVTYEIEWPSDVTITIESDDDRDYYSEAFVHIAGISLNGFDIDPYEDLFNVVAGQLRLSNGILGMNFTEENPTKWLLKNKCKYMLDKTETTRDVYE